MMMLCGSTPSKKHYSTSSFYILQLIWLFWFILMPRLAKSEFGSDTILQGQRMRSWEALSSSMKLFRLQFFSLGSPDQKYLGIFLTSGGDGKPVWIANRNNPIPDGKPLWIDNGNRPNPNLGYSSVTLTNGATDGMLSIDYSGTRVVITNISTTATGYNQNHNTSATLEDDGNLVLRQVFPNGSSTGVVLWQSFDYPTDTLLPGMKIGYNLETGHSWLLTSWSDDQIPTSGSFTLGMTNRNKTNNELIIWWHEKIFWSSGLWHKDNDTFENFVAHNFTFQYLSYKNEKYYIYSQTSESRALRLTPDGRVIEITENQDLTNCYYEAVLYQGGAGCIDYALTFCMKGDPSWMELKGEYGFALYSIKEEHSNLSMIDCKAKCMPNCSCYGYASLYENGTGCEFWDKDSLGFMSVFETGVRSMYVRSSETKDLYGTTKGKRIRRWWIWLVIAVSGTLLFVISIFCIRRYYKSKDTAILMLREVVDTGNAAGQHTKARETNEQKNEKMGQIHQFKYETIEIATNKFSTENKLGEGGFGPVYKGKLIDGQDIAIKRLSRNSSQGVREFTNEVQLIVKLQHRNLVRLLGCCIHREEMMLVYEYMPNKSLDFFLFDPSRRALLKWTMRANIIEGISQGLLYLHKHSRLMVIHRDLKASNILLDENMTPKISDFGMARIFGTKDSEENTKRIVGTRGYMSPEYAIKGIISTKTDVFSFGVLILEIVSSKKNHCSYDSERPLNLIGLAWELWTKEEDSDLVDTTMDVTHHEDEIQRYINVGLLCVQDSAADRPSMTDVIFMLKNESLKLPTPKQPAFFIETSTVDEAIEESQQRNCSNNISTSIMEARHADANLEDKW